MGAGTLFESPVAPARWRIALHVHPAHRRQGVGTALLDALATEAAERDDRALQVGLSAAAINSLDFFARRGFRYLMRTRLGSLDPSRIPESTWTRFSESRRRAQQLALRIQSLANLENPVVLMPTIADLHAKIYQQTHAWSPQAPLDSKTATALYLGEDLIPEALFIAFDGDRPVGVSSLRRGESAMEFDLGWTGVLPEVGPGTPDLTLALLGHTLSFARAANRSNHHRSRRCRQNPLGPDRHSAHRLQAGLVQPRTPLLRNRPSLTPLSIAMERG